MASVEIAGPLRLFDRTVEAVQEAGSLHIEEIPLLEEAQADNLRRIRLTEAQARDKQSLEEGALAGAPGAQPGRRPAGPGGIRGGDRGAGAARPKTMCNAPTPMTPRSVSRKPWKA